MTSAERDVHRRYVRLQAARHAPRALDIAGRLPDVRGEAL